MHCSELRKSQLTTMPHHRPRSRRRMSCSSCGLWRMHYKAPRSMMAVGSRKWVPMERCLVIHSRKAALPHMTRFSESSSAHHMRNSPRDNDSHCPPYFSSKYHLSTGPTVSPLLCVAVLIGSDSFSCLALQEGVDGALRAQHVRLITDVWFLLGCRRHLDADRNV